MRRSSSNRAPRSEGPVGAIVLGLLAGIAVAFYSAFVLGDSAWLAYTRCNPTPPGAQCTFHPFWGFDPTLFVVAAVAGLAIGVLLLILTYLLSVYPRRHRLIGLLLLVGAFASLIAYGGAIVGTILGVGSGVMALRFRPRGVDSVSEWSGAYPRRPSASVAPKSTGGPETGNAMGRTVDQSTERSCLRRSPGAVPGGWEAQPCGGPSARGRRAGSFPGFAPALIGHRYTLPDRASSQSQRRQHAAAARRRARDDRGHEVVGPRPERKCVRRRHACSDRPRPVAAPKCRHRGPALFGDCGRGSPARPAVRARGAQGRIATHPTADRPEPITPTAGPGLGVSEVPPDERALVGGLHPMPHPRAPSPVSGRRSPTGLVPRRSGRHWSRGSSDPRYDRAGPTRPAE